MGRILSLIVVIGALAGGAWMFRYDIEPANNAVVRFDRWTGCAVLLAPGVGSMDLGCADTAFGRPGR